MKQIEIHPTVVAVQKSLTDELRKSKYRGLPNPLAGHCYVAAEALYHLLGGKARGWKPMFIHHEGEPHWFLRHEAGAIVDPTGAQFLMPVPYHRAKGKGFLTKRPSQRARIVMQRARKLLRR